MSEIHPQHKEHNEPEQLREIYSERFEPNQAFREKVWAVLCACFFDAMIPEQAALLDLGCGRGEFVRHVRAGKKWGMDLNPDLEKFEDGSFTALHQDATQPWTLESDSLDIIFSSNFFEHLKTTEDLSSMLEQAYRCLKPGGKLICMGPNHQLVGDAYWAFEDHHLPLTDRTMEDLLETAGFEVERREPAFLPYTMVGRKSGPLWLLRLWLKCPLLWRCGGKQFLLIARR